MVFLLFDPSIEVGSLSPQGQTPDISPISDLKIVIARKPLPAGRQGSNLTFFNEIATPACRNALFAVRTAARHFGVQARTLQVLAMTGWEKGLGF